MKAIKLLVIMVTCLATSQLSAAEGESPMFDLDHFLTEKKALIEETLPLTEQEKQAFWPLYDNYMRELVKLLERRTALNKELIDIQKTITDEQVKAMLDEHFRIVSEGLKVKKSMLVKLRKKIPEKKILKFFQVEQKIEAAYFYLLAEKLPAVK